MAPRADATYCVTLDLQKGTWWQVDAKMHYGGIYSQERVTAPFSACSGNDATGMTIEKVDPLNPSSIAFRRDKGGKCEVRVWGPPAAMYYWYQGDCGTVTPNWAVEGVR